MEEVGRHRIFSVVYTPWVLGMTMTKNASDLILRDRLQFTLDNAGDQATVYGRFDLSDYTSALERKGLSIKEITFMPRNPTSTQFPNTGNFTFDGHQIVGVGETATTYSGLKIYASVRAYEDAKNVGIASPDVLVIETWDSYAAPYDPATSIMSPASLEHNKYSTGDLHPDGFPVVTDLLIGVATDNWNINFDDTLELDVMIIASPISITQKQLTEMLVQGQDQ